MVRTMVRTMVWTILVRAHTFTSATAPLAANIGSKIPPKIAQKKKVNKRTKSVYIYTRHKNRNFFEISTFMPVLGLGSMKIVILDPISCRMHRAKLIFDDFLIKLHFSSFCLIFEVRDH